MHEVQCMDMHCQSCSPALNSEMRLVRKLSLVSSDRSSPLDSSPLRTCDAFRLDSGRKRDRERPRVKACPVVTLLLGLV